MNPLEIIGITFLVTMIGALPFGLVNLSVLHTAFHTGRSSAMKIAHGAAWIEVAFGLTALLLGSVIGNAIAHNSLVQAIAVFIPLLAGVFFLVKKSNSAQDESRENPGFLKGAFLNLISVQVFLYWVIAITWLKTNMPGEINSGLLVFFIPAVWLAKMSVLWIYARFSKPILQRSSFVANNINRIIGGILIFSGILQFI